MTTVLRANIMRHIMTLVVTLLGLSSGCAHYGNLELDSDASDCHTQVYRSSVAYPDGMLRHAVVERVNTSAGPCDEIELENRYYAPDGTLERTVIDQRACGLVRHRLVQRSGPAGAVVEIFEDTDENGTFDVHRIEPNRGEPRLATGQLARN